MLFRGRNVIAFGVDKIELAGLTFNLPTQYERSTGVKSFCIGPLGAPVLFLLGDIDLTNLLGDVRYILGLCDVERRVFLKVSLYLRHNRLARRQVTGGQQNQ